jgi:hypothetical protein
MLQNRHHGEPEEIYVAPKKKFSEPQKINKQPSITFLSACFEIRFFFK